MKKLFLIFLLCLLSTSSLYAKADIYVATGVLTAEPDTDADRDALQEDLIASNPEIYESQSFKSVYNTTHGFWDFIEGAAQLFEQNGWSIYWDSFITLTHSRLTQHYIDYYSGVSKNHGADLSLQKEAYKASINAGNQVIVIAHSQGNFFTNEVYDSLSPCEQRSFYMLGTANPADHVSGMDEGRGALATLDNDPITFVPSSMSANIINSERFNVAGLDIAHYKFHFFEYYRNNNSVSKDKIDTFPEYAIHHYNENNSHTSTPVSGIIDIKLSWGNPSIHMNLQSDIGIKDISYSGCSPLEHYYVAGKEDVSPGTYGVYVNNSGGVDDSYLPQNVSLNIHAPGAVTVFDFDITAADMLNLGHVANIIITEDKESEIVPKTEASETTSNVTIKCYGECKGSSNSNVGGTYKDYLYEVQSKLKQALLGPLSAADITLTKAEIFLNSLPFYESSTSDGNSLLTSGIFYFTNEVLSTLESDAYYVMSVIGGDDIDANDDGILDLVSTHNYGSIHAVIETNTLKNENFKVNILTEIAFQLTQEMMNQELNITALQEKLDDIAVRLLIEDVDGNKEINYKDILAWVPIGDKEKLRKSYEEFYEPIVQKIYKNQAIYNDTYALAYEPVKTLILNDTTLKVLDNYTALSEVGTLDMIKNNNIIENITLSGNGSGDFTVDTDGVIRVAQGVTLQASRQDYYNLTVLVNEIYEATLTVNIYHRIISTFDTPGYAYDVAISADSTKAYVADSSSGLQIIDFTDPTAPTIIASIDIPDNANSVTLSSDGSKVYVTDYNSGLQIIDISDPTASTIIASIDTPNFANSVTLSADGTRAYVADSGSGLQIIDISDPTAPTIIVSLDTPSDAYSVTLSADGNKAYVADGWSGLQVIDVSNPTTPTILASISTADYAYSVALSADGTKAYVADGAAGLQIIDLTGLN